MINAADVYGRLYPRWRHFQRKEIKQQIPSAAWFHKVRTLQNALCITARCSSCRSFISTHFPQLAVTLMLRLQGEPARRCAPKCQWGWQKEAEQHGRAETRGKRFTGHTALRRSATEINTNRLLRGREKGNVAAENRCIHTLHVCILCNIYVKRKMIYLAVCKRMWFKELWFVAAVSM